MIIDRSDFLWVRYPRGTYEWREIGPGCEHGGLLFVKNRGAPDRSVTYAPLETENLFLQFADLPRTHEAILSFVDRWGPLGDAPYPSKSADSSETFVLWDWEIARMNLAVQKWGKAPPLRHTAPQVYDA